MLPRPSPLVTQDVPRHAAIAPTRANAAAPEAAFQDRSTAPSALHPRTAERQQTSTNGSSAAELTEVHVHIGRLEIQVPATAAARKPSRPARRGMSLDEHLARRNRRAP